MSVNESLTGGLLTMSKSRKKKKILTTDINPDELENHRQWM